MDNVKHSPLVAPDTPLHEAAGIVLKVWQLEPNRQAHSHPSLSSDVNLLADFDHNTFAGPPQSANLTPTGRSLPPSGRAHTLMWPAQIMGCTFLSTNEGTFATCRPAGSLAEHARCARAAAACAAQPCPR